MMWNLKKYFLYAITLSVITALYLILCTNHGLNYGLQLANDNIPGQLAIKSTEGSLLGGFSIKDLNYSADAQKVSFERIDFQWNPTKILSGKIDISLIHLKNGNIHIKNSENEDYQDEKSKSIIGLKKYFNLKKVVIDNLNIFYNGATAEINTILDDKWSASLRSNIPDISIFSKDIKGSLTNNIVITGTKLIPVFKSNTVLTNFKKDETSVPKLTLQSIVNINNNSKSAIALSVAKSKLNGETYNSFNALLKINSKIENNNLNFDFITLLENTKVFNGTLEIFDYLSNYSLNKKIRGVINFNDYNITKFNLTPPNIKNLNGIINGNIKISGKLQKPNIDGNFNLKNLSLEIPALGIKPTAGYINAKFDSLDSANITGKINLSSGGLTFKSNIDLKNENGLISLNISGDNAKVVDLPEYKVYATPNLKISWQKPNLEVNGTILIPKATISPKNFSSTVTLPEEAVIVNEKPKENNVPSNLFFNIGITLGNNINVNYNNIEAKIGGKLNLIKNSNSPAIGQGELYTIGGKYEAYGQKLTIDRGRIIYSGNTLANPGLNIRASKTIRSVATENPADSVSSTQAYYAGTRDLNVGIKVQGTARRPLVSFFSSPISLSQTDILSYLIFGFPQSQASSNQGAALFTILSTMNPNSSKVGGVTSKLQDALGLTEFNIESVESFNPESQSVESNTSVVIGKQITKKISLHYSVGLFDTVYVLNLRYQFNKNWALQTETNTIDNGADILYVIERD